MSTNTLTGATYRTRDFSKATLIGKILVDQGFEVSLHRTVTEVIDLNAGTSVNRGQGYETVLRTNANRQSLDEARATYREALASVANDAVSKALAAKTAE